MKEALYWEKLDNNKVKCNLCPNYCVLSDGQVSTCNSRKNVSGVLIAFNYARTVSLNMDPIEKKPLYHYYPGTRIFSLGPNSCNLHCQFCQNYEISQEECPTKVISPEDLLDLTLRQNLDQVAFTYTEPFTWYEYIYDCAKLLSEHKIKTVLVTNGYINPEPLIVLLPYIDAMNIDLKSIRPDFYRKICKGKLEPVLETIRLSAKACHVELTNLLIPDLNDTEDEIEELVNFVADVNPSIPLHFSRYYPQWKCSQPPTPEKTLLKAYEIASSKLKYVYLGNIQPGKYSDTYCPSCSKLLISRGIFSASKEGMKGNKCSGCGYTIYGRF